MQQLVSSTMQPSFCAESKSIGGIVRSFSTMASRACIASSDFCMFLSVRSAESNLGGNVVTTDEIMGDDVEEQVVVMLSQPSALMTSISCMGSTSSKVGETSIVFIVLMSWCYE